MNRRHHRRTRPNVSPPLFDLLRLHPRLTMLKREDCLKIYRASCQVLRQTEVRV